VSINEGFEINSVKILIVSECQLSGNKVVSDLVSRIYVGSFRLLNSCRSLPEQYPVKLVPGPRIKLHVQTLKASSPGSVHCTDL